MSTPLHVVWETTRSCALSCAHCRTGVNQRRDPLELTQEEGLRLIEQAADAGARLLTLSGGDPLNREDLEELVGRAKTRGLRVVTTPAATANLTRARLASLQNAGLDQVAFSLDASKRESQDRFCRAQGTFAKVLEAAAWAHELRLPVQVNTCLSAWNWGEFEEIVDLVRLLDASAWQVFFLIPTGRGAELGGLSPAAFEAAFERLWRLSREVDFSVDLIEAQHYRRFLLRRQAEHGDVLDAALPARAANAGDGGLFVDHRGGICPSEFLPEVRGNVRADDLGRLYREDALFTGLRDHDRLGGACGKCLYREPCGGSRARAYAVTGDAWAADPSCAYLPPRP